MKKPRLSKLNDQQVQHGNSDDCSQLKIQSKLISNREKHVTMILSGPLFPVLVKLALPTVGVMFLSALVSVAETYFVSSLGVDSIAGASLVIPMVMLMIMMSNGGIGGGVSSAVARAIGASDIESAERLAYHATLIGIAFGGLFTLVLLVFGRPIYASLGGTGDALQQALLYSDILFGSATINWVYILLQSALRGAGNVKVPALITLGNVLACLLLSPVLILGLLGTPKLGIAGAGYAQLICNAASLLLIIGYMRSSSSILRLRRHRIRYHYFKQILAVGLPSSLSAIFSNLSVTAITSVVGVFGVPALAGYGIASRMEYLLIPVMFGFGTAVLTIVGTNIGAGNIKRARQAALLNALFVGAMVELVGLSLAYHPGIWMNLFTSSTDVLFVGEKYLKAVGPVYGMVAFLFAFYFAGQGAGKVFWPITAIFTRFAFAACGSIIVFLYHQNMDVLFSIIAIGGLISGMLSAVSFLMLSERAKQIEVQRYENVR
ncbi:MATE family efflux transporter [Methylomonas sp. HW2-6]|uniref:MATE family efflux transporter n=1 Tax=Methylomonas sp. HW2-6 TaxID=3376687 RepID=UPI004042DB89